MKIRSQKLITDANQLFFPFLNTQVDCLSDDNKIEVQRDVRQRVADDLSDQEFGVIQLSFHLTSIYDHSIFEAFSKVVQKLIPQLPVLESLLNLFISVSLVFRNFENLELFFLVLEIPKKKKIMN